MTNIIWDTETTGLPMWNRPSSEPGQPHLVQIALLMVGDDGTEISAASMIVRPDGWVIPPEMTAIHGISHERAMDEGVAESLATEMFVALQGKARLRVAHNESFDRRIMRIAMIRAGLARDFIELIEARASYCTCNAAKPIVNLPPTTKMLAAGINTPKSPKLEECIKHFFNEALVGGHDALVDARGCARIYQALTMKKDTAP